MSKNTSDPNAGYTQKRYKRRKIISLTGLGALFLVAGYWKLKADQVNTSGPIHSFPDHPNIIVKNGWVLLQEDIQ